MRLNFVFGVLVAAGALAAPASAQQAVRPCTPAELQRSELVNGHLPFQVRRGGEAADVLASHSVHEVIVTPTGNVIPETIRMFDQTGELPRVPGGLQATFRLVTGAAGSHRVAMTWEQEVVVGDGIPTGERCAGAGTDSLTVRDPTLVRLERVLGRKSFQLRVRLGPQPPSTAPVTYELRVRRGSARPPTLRTRAIARFRYGTGHLGPSRRSDRRSVPGVGEVKVVPEISGPDARGRILITPGLVPRGQTRRFGFSLRVLQGGRVVGGMRAGVRCRGATRSSLRCTRHGYVAQP